LAGLAEDVAAVVAAELFGVWSDASLCLAVMNLEHTYSQKKASEPYKNVKHRENIPQILEAEVMGLKYYCSYHMMWVEIFHTHQDQPWDLPILLLHGYWVISRGKVDEAWR
jgi:hypothetical protein